MKKLKKQHYSAFTLLEMLVVLLIISVLLLLFVPNLSKQREKIESQGSAALGKVVHTQVELYKIENNDSQVTWNKLQKGGYLTAEQVADAKKNKISLE